MPQDIRFYDDGKGNVRQVAADKVDRFKSMFPDAREANESQLTEIENKRANDNEQQRLASSDINVSVPTVEKVDLSLSDNQNPFSRKGMDGAIDIASQHHRSNPDVQFRAKYGAYKDNPELHRDEDAPEMVERRKKQPWYSYIGGGNAVVNATKQNQYGEENQEDATKTRQSQDYLETRTNKADKHKEKDLLSDFLTNTQSGRDALEYDKNVTKYFEELKPIVEKQRIALQQQVNDVNEKRKIYGRKARAANLIISDEQKKEQDPSYIPTWDRKLDVERAQQEYKENYEALVALPEPNDVKKAQEALTSLKNMKEALNDRDKSAVQQYLGEIKRNASKELVDAITFGTKGMIEDMAGVKGGPLTDKVMETTQMFANINENLMKDQRSLAQDIALGSLQNAGFILQMGLTSGPSKGIVGAGGKVLSKLFSPTTKAIARRVAFETGAKAVSVAGREISEVFVQAFLMPATLASALERNAANPGHFLNSWAAAYKSALVEVGSERIGDFIPMGKFKSPLVNKVMQATHLNNIPVEFLEEQIGTLGHIAMGTGEGEWSDFTDKRNQLVTLGVVTSSGMPYLAIESGGYAAGKYQVVKQKYEISKSYKNNVKEMQAEFGEEANDIMSVIESSMDSMKDDLTAIQTLTLAIANTEGLNDDQQNTVFTFAMAATAKKGLERAKQEAKESAKQANAETLKEYVNENTGTVTLVNVAGMDAPVAVQGDIVFTEDGKIDTHNSGVLYYTDNDGKKQVVNPQFVDLVESTPAEQVEDVLNQTSEQEIENEYANDEVRAYEAGEVIRYAVNEQQSIVGTIQGVDNNGNYIVYVDGFGEATIEPRMIVPEDNLKGVQNGTMVEYTNDKGEVVVGEVQDMISLRNAGLVMIDGQEVPTQNIVGVEGTVQVENATIEEDTAQQEAEETEVTPEQQAEQEKETFIQSLPVNNKGEIDQKQMTTAQTMQYFEYSYGAEETLKAAEQQIKNQEAQLKSAQTRLNSDPFNIAKREKVGEIQSELEEYKAYVFDKKKAKAQEIADTSTSSIAEEQAKQEKERAEAEAQRQAEQADIEALKGIPDVTVDKAKDARARGYRSVNGVRVDRRKTIPIQHYKDVVRKFSTNEKDHVKAQRTIVEADDLVPSHKGGQKNPEFFNDEGQPKQRTDEASKAARESIATNPNPKEITGGVSAYTGAPLFKDNGEIIQGNGRTDGLQEMWENHPDAAAIYKQHLIETAAEYGMTPEQVMAMKKPIAGDRVSVTDAEAIRLGQLSAQDTESGGTQRIPAKQTSVALGENMGRFAQILFESTNEDAISTVIEKNGRKAIDYLRQKGVINPTQYQSAFDKDGNITPEAKKDLQDIASQMLFEGANENIEQMFDKLPDKAQKAILQTIHRDAKSPKSERIVKELQQAIEAYYHLQGHDGFANATDYKSATIAARAAKNSTVMFNSESDLPLQKYSNFAIEMAVLFKTDTQKELRQRFNSLYDNIQGVGGDVFNAAEKLSLVEAIKKHFNNIDYVSDGQTKRTDVAGNSKTSGKGRQEGAGEAASGERAETGGKPTDSGAGTNTDNKQGGKTKANLTQEREITKAIKELSAKLNTPFTIYNSAKEIPESEHKARQSKAKAWYIPSTGEVFINAFNATSVQDVRVSIFHEVVAHKGMRDMLGKEKHAELMNNIFNALPKQIQDALFEKYKSKEIAADEYVAYLAENEKNLTPQEKGTWESIKQAIIDFIENHIGIKLTEQNVDAVIRGLLVESKKRLENKGKPINLVEVAKESVEKGEIDKAAREVNTNPTEAQKEAGNYKMGHVKIAGLDITIENPKGSQRSGTDATGKPWSITMQNDYGYIKQTKGKDGDHIDIFIGENLKSDKVFVVDQVNEDGAFDEHKVMLGFESAKQAKEAYLSNYEDGWNGLKDITETTVEDFKKWTDTKTRKSKAFAEYKGNQVAAKEKLKQEEKKKEQPAEKIEDFGEVIEGAKKHTYQRIETTETDMQSQPLSKTFPKPNYSKLVEDGVLTKKGAMVLKHAYEALPSKPRKKFRVAAWVKEVEKVIATYNSLIENKDVGDSLHDKLVKQDSFDSDYADFVEIQEAFGFPEKDVNMGAYRVIPPNRTQRSTGIDKQWLIVKGNSIYGKADSAEGIARVFNQMVDKNKKKGVALSIYRDTKTNEYFIGRKTGGGIARLVEGLTREEVTRMYKEDMPKLQEMWEARKVKPDERRKENRKRVGTDYRKGKDVTPEQFGEAFGFRGVQFGNWVNSVERQEALNDAYDAFMDLSNAIGVSPRALSLAGELGMAFGARGSGNAMAHYESGKVVINLTKTKGAGSLAHEWWHAMDSYFSRMRGEKQGFLTESPRQKYKTDGGKRVLDTSIRTEMHEAFLEVMNAINNSDLPKRSKELDKSRSKAYWATQLEMSARAFEGYIIDKLGETGEQNDYLANFKDTGEWASSSAFDMKNYPYPTVDENAAINEAFESLFDAMQEKEEDGKTILYRETTETPEFKKWFGDWRANQSIVKIDNNRLIIDGKDVGLIEHSDKGAYIEIEKLYIDKDKQKQGNGKKAIAHLANKYGKEIKLYPLEAAPFLNMGVKRMDGEMLVLDTDKYNSSKVVNEEGKPLVVYHGTDQRFTEFKQGENKSFEPRGFYFTPLQDIAKNYTSGTENLMPVFLSAKNLYEANNYMEIGKLSIEQIEKLKEDGYDGAHYTPKEGEAAYMEEYVVFNPNQIKSATANDGSFNKENEDIRYRLNDVSDKAEIEEEKSKYGGKTHKVSKDKVNFTLYQAFGEDESGIATIDFSEAFDNIDDIADPNNSNYTGMAYGLYARDVEATVEDVKTMMEYEDDVYEGDIEGFINDVISDYALQADDLNEIDNRTILVYESELDNTDTDKMIDELAHALATETGATIKKYSSFYVDREGNMTNEPYDLQNEDLENISVNMRIADHTHNPSNGRNDLNVLIADRDATRGAFRGARTHLEFTSESSIDEIINEIKEYWNEFAQREYEDYRGSDIRYREGSYPLNYKLDNDYADYYIRHSDHIESDMKRGWSSWNFGEEGFKGTEEELQEALSNITDTSPFWISGFDIYPDIIDEFEIKELYPNYWVVVDNENAIGGLSAHMLPNNLSNIEDALKEINSKKWRYDGTGDGESFSIDNAKVIYSKGDMHIIEVGENNVKQDNDIRYREGRPQFSDAIETVVERFVDCVTLKENEFQKDAPNLKELVLFNDVKDYGMYDKYEIVPVSNPVVNIHNLNSSIYGLGSELRPLNDLHSKGLLNFKEDTGYFDAKRVKAFAKEFNQAIEPYETALLKTKHFATEAAQKEIMDIIKDIDHARDYYNRLAKDHNVLRSEDAPRFRDAESISELADMVGSDMTEETRKEYDKKYNSFASRFREAWEDSYLPVKQFQDLLEKNGLKIEEHNDYYKQATHVPGKNDFQLEHYKKTYQHPITLAVNALQDKGFKYREIENYVFAKHGIERNEFMRRDEARNYADAIRQRAEIKAKQEQRSIDNKLSNDAIDQSEHEKQTNKIERAKLNKLKESDAVEERKYQELQGKDYAGLTQLMEEVNPEGMEQGRTLQDMAEEYNKDFEDKAGEELIKSLWGNIKKATDFTLDNHYKTGGVSRDVYLELKGRYQNFVPLRGHDQEVAEDRWHYTQGNMGEFYSGAIIKAQGRRSRAESPFAYIGQMAHSSIMRGNKNTLNQTLLRLAHKDKSGLMDVKRTWYVNKGTLENPMWEAEAAEFSDNIDTYLQNQIDFEKRMKEMQEIGMAAQSSKHLNIGGLFIKPKQAEQHEVQVDQNGVHYTIYINANPAIARAINGDNKKSIAKDMGFIGNVTRAMAMNFTTRNPLFIARNFSRDYIYANTMLMVKEDATYTARFNKNIPLAFAALTRQKNGNLDLKNETDLHLYEFMMNGGRTGFSHIFELKRAAKALEREAKKGDSKSALDYGRVALGAIDVVNDVVENATRFSTYMASRQAGRSITQSVHDAKNVTVNFNQKGAGSSIGNNSFERFILSAAGWVRPLYLFTNAAVQALSNVGKATKKHPVKMGAAITSFALMGFLSPIIAGMIGGDDEEDDFMKMSDWDRQNNWIIPVGSGYIKIPLPHEMRVFHRLGDNIYQASTGRKDTLETMLDMMFALSDLAPMNPLGAADASWAELMPDFIKPYLQHHATNTSFMGTRIYNQWANPYAPGYTKVSTNKKGEAYAPAFLIELYKGLDHLTGGDGVKKGAISLNPDVTNHYMRGWFGGLWTIAEQSIDIGYKATEWSKTGELNLKVRETPLSSFYSDKNDLNVSSGSTGQRYYNIMKDVNEARRRSKGYVKKVRDGDMSIHELTRKMEELDMPKVNALYERVKEVKAMEGRLKDLEGKEQKDLEKEIFEKKKIVVEMK